MTRVERLGLAENAMSVTVAATTLPLGVCLAVPCETMRHAPTIPTCAASLHPPHQSVLGFICVEKGLIELGGHHTLLACMYFGGPRCVPLLNRYTVVMLANTRTIHHYCVNHKKSWNICLPDRRSSRHATFAESRRYRALPHCSERYSQGHPRNGSTLSGSGNMGKVVTVLSVAS